MIPAIVIAVVVISVVASILRQRARSRRSRLLPLVAADAGMSFSATDLFNSIGVAFPLFREGDGRLVENVMWREGPNGNPLRVFDYGYFTLDRNDTGRRRKHWRWFSCATIEHGGSWPSIQISRKSLVGWATEDLALPRVSLESEEFNDTFSVQCEDPKFATDLIDAQMMEFLIGTQGRVDFVTRGRFLLVFCDLLDDPNDLPVLAEITSRFIKQVPAVVAELYPNFPSGGAETIDMPTVAYDVVDNSEVASLLGFETGVFDRRSDDNSFEFAPAPDFRAPDPLDPTPGVDHDLDGRPVAEQKEDPWGPGRDLA